MNEIEIKRMDYIHPEFGDGAIVTTPDFGCILFEAK
jgi:hypothetical protein